MATEPEAWQEQGPVNSIDKEVNESWAQGEVGATTGPRSSPSQEARAPRAEPEEDIDGQTLQENQTLSRSQTGDATELENEDSRTTGNTRETVTEEVPEKISEASQAEEESENPANFCEDAFPSPPPPLTASSTDECLQAEGLSSPAAEVSEWISDAQIISDPAEDLMSHKEWALTTQLSELAYQEVEWIPEEMTAGDIAAEENDTQPPVSLKDSNNSEPESNISAHHSSSDSNNNFDHVHSPPFADESEEEEQVSMDIASCQQEWSTLDITSKPLQPSYSNADEQMSLLPAVHSAKQQGELLPQSHSALAPKRANQEAAQQVLGRSSPPLSTVAMEPSNRGGAASQCSGCIEALRERHSGAGESTEGGSEQTGEEEGQKESGPDRSRAEGQHSRGPLRSVQRQEGHMSEKYDQGVNFQYRKHGRMQSASCDDSQSDSGVSADFSPASTLEGNTTVSGGAPASKETPIEREIRRTIEREHSLRRSRGLPTPPTSPEYVEIPLRKSPLSQSLTKSEWSQGKDNQFAGKKMQQEIQEEAQREQDLVKLGKVPGIYDKGTVRQLKDRKLIFEAFQQPSDSTLTLSTRSETTSWSSASDVSTLEENQEDSLSRTSTTGDLQVERRWSTDLLSPPLTPYSAKGMDSTYTPHLGIGFSKETSDQVIIIENNPSVPAQKLYHTTVEAEPVTTVDSGGPNITLQGTGRHDGLIRDEEEEEEEELAPKDNPFFKLRSLTNVVKVEQDIRETQEREKELRKQRLSLYGGAGCPKGGGVEGPEEKSSSPLNVHTVPDIPDSSPRWRSIPSAAQQSEGKVSIWPPAQAEEERSTQPEDLCSPRTPRQKSPLVQRWESGLVNGHNEEDD